MGKNIITAKKGKRYCIDNRINRQIRRDRMRTKTGILIFLSVFMTGVVVLLALVIGSIFGIDLFLFSNQFHAF